MGKPLTNGVERFEKFQLDGIIVWRSNAVFPSVPGQPITIDYSGWLFFRKRLVVKNAR
jgi:hypothetical protein